MRNILVFTALGFALFACTRKEMSEVALLAQLKGSSCDFLADRNAYNSNLLLMDDYIPKCNSKSLIDEFTTRNFSERCRASGAICLLTMPNISEQSSRELEAFLLTGANDVDTGDGIFSIRGTSAIVYAKILKEKAVPTLEKALLRTDPTEKSISGSYPVNYKFAPGTSHEVIREAIKLAKSARH